MARKKLLYLLLLALFIAGAVMAGYLIRQRTIATYPLPTGYGDLSAESGQADIPPGQLPPGPEERSLRLLFFGDLMIDRHVGEKITKYGFDYPFADIKRTTPDFWSGYDLISANLEGAATDRGAHYKPDQAYDFAFAPELIKKLHNYNFSFFNLANNHLADQGERGIIETENNLQKSGFLIPAAPTARRKNAVRPRPLSIIIRSDWLDSAWFIMSRPEAKWRKSFPCWHQPPIW